MAISADFIDELLSRISLSDLISKRVKLVRKGNRMNGLCPFHGEKTPSFYVNDGDGFYHCFGCGANGDAITYLRESEGLDFMEAVSRLAELAGMVVPDSRPADKEAENRRRTTLEVCEAAARYFTHHLSSETGDLADQYLDSRGVNAELRAEFRLGYAPRQGLYAQLQQAEFPYDICERVGLCARSDRDQSVYDYFRHRVMFPIENRQGQVIAFGARAFGDAKPKYLNSPDGPSFSKKNVLYGWPQARKRIRQGLPLLIVEGYMDVIAVSASGIAAALAPLGTALTEQQIQLAWKLHSEPVLCFDGDAAGQKAALRSIERVLPVLEPGRNVRFALLPDGQDPDDILKSEGADGLARVITSSLGLMDMLWAQKFSEYGLDKPNVQPTQRAAFWQELRQMVRLIVHNQTRTAFLDELEYRISAMRAEQRSATASPSLRSGQSGPRRKRPKTGRHIQYHAIFALIISFPELFDRFGEEFGVMSCDDQALESLKNTIISTLISSPDLDADALKHHLRGLDYAVLIDDLFGPDMVARFGAPLETLESDKAEALLGELFERLAGTAHR